MALTPLAGIGMREVAPLPGGLVEQGAAPLALVTTGVVLTGAFLRVQTY